MSLLSVKNLGVEFKTERGLIQAVRDVSFDVEPGETVGIVGESGCGKTVTGLSLLGLIPNPPGNISSGRILFEDQDLTGYSEKQMRGLRGKDMAMIFQEPMTALNPVFTIGTQLMDILRRHQKLSEKQAKERALELLQLVHIPAPQKRLHNYPHQLSGGMRQRIMIAMALCCHPKLLIADEPTTALDVTTQAQVLSQMKQLQEQFNMGLILITHDLGVVAETCQKVIVMYCGRVIEQGLVKDIFSYPQHPYTAGLLASIPRIREKKIPQLPTIEGMVPDLLHLPKGCSYQDRCSFRSDQCLQQRPPLVSTTPEHRLACFNPLKRS